MLFVGDDWAEDHHDVFLMNDTGGRLASRRLPEGLAGMRAFHELIAAHAEDSAQVVVGIETERGLWVDALTAAGYQVVAVSAQSRWAPTQPRHPSKPDSGNAAHRAARRARRVAATTRAAVGIIIELNRQISDLEAELATHLETHPDADIYRSLPGLGVILCVRVLGEFGDAPTATPPPSLARTTPEHHR